jgi:MFS family permease
MPRVPLVDRLMLWLFGVARTLFLLQTLAFGCGAMASMAWGGASSSWARRGLMFGALLSGTFAAASLLLGWLRSSPPPDTRSDSGTLPWPAAFGLSLVLIIGLTVLASAELPALWGGINVKLTAIGFWEGITASSQFGGIVLLPILMALCVPGLVTATALFSGLFPIVLLARLPFRPLMFSTIAGMGAVVQTALAASSWLASTAMSEISQAAVVAMSGAPDQEVVQLAGELVAAVAVLTTTATMLLVPTAALVAWGVFLRPSGAAARQFGSEPT